MGIYNEFKKKVTEITEDKVILGKVVELSNLSIDEYDNPFEFKIVEYFINEYNTYTSLEIARFTVKPNLEPERRIEEFKNQIGNYYDEDEDIYVSKNAIQVVMAATTDIFSVIKKLMKKSRIRY